MRGWFRGVFAGSLALLVSGSAASGPDRPAVSVSSEPLLVPASRATIEFALEPSVPAPHVVEVLPRGERVPVDMPLSVRFDQDVPTALRQKILGLDPPVSGETRWPAGNVLEFRPGHWRQGRVQRARISLDGQVHEWGFRARVPMPLQVTPGDGARLVLSFDDGPNDRVEADRLLDLLKELDVRALFFPTGRWAKTRADWVERAAKEGHRVCNHTQNHVNLTAPWMTEERIRSEIQGGAGDGSCKLFRPPLMGFDHRVERIAREFGLELYLWDIDSRDWEGGPGDDVMATVLGQARPDAVVLFHVHAKNTFAILTPLVERLRAAGYVLSWDPQDAADGGVGRSGSEARAEWLKELERPTDEMDLAEASP